MKKRIALELIYPFYFIILFIVVTSNTSYSQEKMFKNEILVYILPDTLELPNELATITDINKATIKSKTLSRVMHEINIKRLEKAFQNFEEKDTLKTLRSGKKIKMPNLSRIFKIILNDENNVDETVRILSKEKGVLFAEKNGRASSSSIEPNDEYFNLQWGLKNGITGNDIHAPDAWEIQNPLSNTIIAVVDGGIDKTHPDLLNNVSGDNGVTYNDFDYDHGTHIAGIIAANSNNNIGIAGVSWYSQLHSENIDNTDDIGKYQGVVDAVDYSSNVRVLNNSWKLVDPIGRNSTIVRMAFAYAYKNDRVAVAAMGNNGQSIIHYPAGFQQGVIAVGATNSNDARWSWSNYGNHIDVVAPGVGIYSTFDDDYDYMDGTSMATGFVSGIAGLILSYNYNNPFSSFPSLENDDVENIIKLSANDLGAAGWDIYYGSGRVNANEALSRITEPYVLEHNSVAGGTIYSSTGPYYDLPPKK